MNRETDVECPSCSPDKKVLHEVLHTGKKLVVRCAVCHTTQHVEPPRRPAALKLRVVVSYYDQSHVGWFELGVRERLHVGDDVIVENSSIDAVRITAIELSDGVRTAEAEAESIRVLWAQKIDKVVVKIAVHTGKTTRSHKVPFDGEKKFVIGTEERLGKITRIKVKQGPVLDHAGQCVQAKDVGRVYIEGTARRSADRNQISLVGRKPARGR
ncbi:MAG: HVO_0476 family zinc finger protein [Euryarchaeota archaeon]